MVADDRKRISCDDAVRSSSGSDKGRSSGGGKACQFVEADFAGGFKSTDVYICTYNKKVSRK